MVAVPTPFDAAAGNKLTALNLDAGVRDPLLFLLDDYPRVHAYDASSASMANGVATLEDPLSSTLESSRTALAVRRAAPCRSQPAPSNIRKAAQGW